MTETEWIKTEKAALVSNAKLSTFKGMSKHDFYGLDRVYEGGHASPLQGRAMYFNSAQIERVADLCAISGITLPSAIKVVIAQGGEPPEPWNTPEGKAAKGKNYLGPLKNRISQIRELVPQKEYNSPVYRYVCELIKICDRLLSELGESRNGQDYKI